MILCCGEALIDMIPEPTVAGRQGYVPHAGGAVFNTSVALGRLGVKTGLLTGLSNDLFGQQLSDALRESHVDTRLIIISDRPTTLAFVQLQDGHASYSFYDKNSAGRMIAPSDLPEIPNDTTALYFGGISLACEPGAKTYCTFAERHAATRLVVLDPNIRPDFIADETHYRTRLDRMISLADIVKVSDEDLDWFDPAPTSLEGKVNAMLSRGPSLVIVTRGGEGATGYLKDGTVVEVPAQQVQIADTVGAGDTFNAGVMASLSQQGLLAKHKRASWDARTVATALAFGEKVAAVTVSRIDATPPWAEELVAGS
ncbi:carbohydrate kinase [Aliiroseovarius sp. S2029]|uniref:carbohydrate kinase family protein n=1 Tax=Aliiroseovarius sp. S2029 TaxID=2936988 RepID=UPI0020BD52AF|nr:carbohydrate kinase [Aliiroseovarius sp. S2029]MCK8482789.1 carbohydrate kinase [Aliiroseovarius sp. S2029]